MERKKRDNHIALIVFIITGIIAIGVLIFFAGKFNFLMGGSYRLHIQYDYLDNLLTGAKVKVSGGPEIGYVRDINLVKDKLIVTVDINSKFKINRGARFGIYATSLVGLQYINVSGFNPDYLDHYTNNELVIGQNPMGVAQLFESAGTLIESLQNKENMQNLSDTLSALSEGFNEAVLLIENLNYVISNNKGNIDESFTSLSSSLNDISQMMESVDSVITELQRLAVSLNNKVDSVNEKDIKIIMDNLKVTSIELSKLSKDISGLPSDTNSVLYLLKERSFKNKVDNMATYTEQLLEILKDNPSALIFGASKKK